LRLPRLRFKGKFSFEEVVKKRRSIRDFSSQPLSLEQVSQILWVAQGITGEDGFGRACPSAGALYPIEIYVEVSKVKGVEEGIYHYGVFDHSLELVTRGDYSQELAEACLSQLFIAEAPVAFIIGVEYSRVTWKYGERGMRYTDIEVGHCGQNICLQATALELAAVPVGAFWDRQVQEVVYMSKNIDPIYVIPVGYPLKEGG